MSDDNKPSPPEAFSGRDVHKIRQAIERLAKTQLGAISDPFTGDELAGLFVPSNLLKSLREVYRIESRENAYGSITIDLPSVLREPFEAPFAEPAACIVKSAKLNVNFHRDGTPDGFMTPSPIFGAVNKPVLDLLGNPDSELRGRFEQQMLLMVRVMGEWACVKWVFEKLQNSVRTPQQMRYVWPAIYPLAVEAKLKDAHLLAHSSSRSGLNASPAPECREYLKPTYEIVANSVLLGHKTEFYNRYSTGQLRVNCVFELLNKDGTWFSINDI